MNSFTGGVRDFFGVSSAKPYSGRDETLGTYSSVGSGRSGRLKLGYNPDTTISSIEQRANMSRVTRKGRGRTTSGGKGPARPKKRVNKKRKATKRGSFKKPKKVRKVATKYHNHRYEVEGTCDATQPYMYVGINDCYKRGAIWDAMADAVLRPILAREFKFRPLQDTDKIGNMLSAATTGVSKRVLVFGMKRVHGITGVNLVTSGFDSDAVLAASRVDLDDTTYDTMRTRVSTILQDWGDAALSSSGANRFTDLVGYFPYQYSMISNVGTVASASKISIITSFDHLGDTSIDLRFSQKTMFVNRTLAEGGSTAGQNLDRLGTNPLKGKLYQFNNAAPRVLDHVDMSAALKTSIQSDPLTGMDKYMSTSADDSHLAHPLSSKFWLKNCVKESNILLQPGQTKSHSTLYTIKGRLSTIIERVYFAGYDKGTFGQSSLFMFDMVHKSGHLAEGETGYIAPQFPTTTYKRSCMVQSAGKLKVPKIYIPDFEAVTENL